MAHPLTVDAVRQLDRDDVELLRGKLIEARTHPADLGIVVVQVQPRPGLGVQSGRADVDHAVVGQPRIDPLRPGLELACPNAHEHQTGGGS